MSRLVLHTASCLALARWRCADSNLLHSEMALVDTRCDRWTQTQHQSNWTGYRQPPSRKLSREGPWDMSKMSPYSAESNCICCSISSRKSAVEGARCWPGVMASGSAPGDTCPARRRHALPLAPMEGLTDGTLTRCPCRPGDGVLTPPTGAALKCACCERCGSPMRCAPPETTGGGLPLACGT